MDKSTRGRELVEVTVFVEGEQAGTGICHCGKYGEVVTKVRIRR